MDEMNIAWFLFGILFIIVGITGFFTPFNIWSTKVVNQFKGVKTNITSRTIKTWKLVGLFFIFLGFMAIYSALTN